MIDSPRVRIKICGITRYIDAAAAAHEGVDALGFIFYDKSPRNIDPEEAKSIIEMMPPFIDVVGVFVDKKRKEVEDIIDYCRLNYVQLHGSESPKYCERLGRFAAPCQVLKALRIRPDLRPEELQAYSSSAKGFLFDTFKKESMGGTGEIFDWSQIERLQPDKPFLLAGGLDVDNITEALEQVRPYGVDANSGLEIEPGIKDHNLIREFIGKVRAYEAAVQRARTNALG